ncbi:hypothetical protein BDN72DRAFT_900009 [Pluteus cervinus]|uniref:Uncharacterized protein n=1 Tax=Pluteus cervinus TaxID=181527 RepID=A0ACD3AKI0_9AGAR|nr:hypothetical protein BDN72DRAFT_900009 [Pluteus cervinus]
MQTKFLVAFILSCTAAFVASAPVPEPTPAPVVDELAFIKRQGDSSSSQSFTISLPNGGGGGMQPDTCRYGCIYLHLSSARFKQPVHSLSIRSSTVVRFVFLPPIYYYSFPLSLSCITHYLFWVFGHLHSSLIRQYLLHL